MRKTVLLIAMMVSSAAYAGDVIAPPITKYVQMTEPPKKVIQANPFKVVYWKTTPTRK